MANRSGWFDKKVILPLKQTLINQEKIIADELDINVDHLGGKW